MARAQFRQIRKGVVLLVFAACLCVLPGCGKRPAPVPASGVAGAPPDSAVSTTRDTGTAKPEAVAVPAPDLVTSELPAPKPKKQDTGQAALDRAAAAGKHLLLLFYRGDDDSTRAMKKVFASAAAKLASKANSISIDVADAAEREIVAKYGGDRAPMPLALVVAPTGAVTGGFPGKVTEEQLSGAFVSPAIASCLKALQDGKFVLLCVQNASTKSNDAALKGAREFKADTRYAKVTELVNMDPSADAESKFLGQLQIDPKTSVAVTALIAPPGSVVAKYTEATDKNTIVAALTAATSGGGGG